MKRKMKRIELRLIHHATTFIIIYMGNKQDIQHATHVPQHTVHETNQLYPAIDDGNGDDGDDNQSVILKPEFQEPLNSNMIS